MLIKRTAPAYPKTIPTSLLPWLRANAPRLERALRLIPTGENLIVPSLLFYESPQKLWRPLPNGGSFAEGWVLLLDGAAKIKLVQRNIDSLRYLYQPAFKLADLSPIGALRINDTKELTFLIGDGAYTVFCYKEEGGALVEVTPIRAE